MHSLKRVLAENGFNWREERNPRAITLETQVFAYVFRDKIVGLNTIIDNDAILQNAAKGLKADCKLHKETFMSQAKRCVPKIMSFISDVTTVVGGVTSVLK